MTKSCPFCGYELANDSSFCPHCFTSLIDKHSVKTPRVKRNQIWLPVLLLLICTVLLSFPLLRPQPETIEEPQKTLAVLHGQNLELPPWYQEPKETQEEIEELPAETPTEESSTEEEDMLKESVKEETPAASQATGTVPHQIIADPIASVPLTLSYKNRAVNEAEYNASKVVKYYNSDVSLYFRLSNKLRSDEVIIYDVQVKLLDGIYQITLDLDAPSGMQIKCFNPSNGSLFKLDGGKTSSKRKKYTFEVSAKHIQKVETVTMLFSYSDTNRFGVFLDTNQFQ